jgi:hypothetical protein
MAAYTVTSANVLKGANAQTATGIAGEAIATAGLPLFIDASDSDKLKLADANASLAASTVAGVSLHPTGAGQPITYVTDDDDFTHGLTTVAIADIIVVGATPGALHPSADLASGWFPQVVMIAKSATKAVLKLSAGGVAKA